MRSLCTWVGDNTYGMYLWHTPIQLGGILLLARSGMLPSLGQQGWFMLAYVVFVVVVARLSFLLIERPARDWLRRIDRPAPRREVAVAAP